jgi:hypothetical protein
MKSLLIVIDCLRSDYADMFDLPLYRYNKVVSTSNWTLPSIG